MTSLIDQVALVTGGGSGIGRAVVDRYVEEGARVAVVDVAEDRLEQLRKAHGSKVIAIQGDVTTVETNERAVKQTVAAFGKLDVLVANAGMGDAFRELIDIPVADVPKIYKEIFDLNVLGVIIGARVAARELVKTKGSIIVTLSNSSFYPDGGGVMYIASKHAALGIVRQLAHEFAPSIRVNGVSPGATKTDIRMPASMGLDERGERIRTHTHPSNKDAAVEAVTPLKMHAEPADHAGAFVLLASRRDSKAMTGTVIESEAGLGVRGLRRVRGGDNLAERLLGQSP
ncbi:MAG TPA: 3-(cis-5,6-dihydroxycyclohexa-1,3-dien-1-yl)propanoate dehydrogenase [Steroidobacteraceae bacterium]|nr:3-(cis-5,6-dihydroxycyclohexa-1,3-dien-1-yl)propanoate dehydrogenase [Steroidobacteraceae bacterium]